MENKFMDAMMFRHACKEFDGSKKIGEEDFRTILEMGRLSPSSFGFEPWRFLVVRNEALKEKMQAFTWGAQKQLPTSSHYVIILARKKQGMLYNSDYINHMMDDVKHLPEEIKAHYSQFYEKFQRSDFKLFESDRAMFDWSVKQTYIAMANMMTGAAYMGIDSCPVEGFDVDRMEAFLKEELEVDTEAFGTAVMVAFGYRKEEPKREKVRQELEEITAWYN